MSPKTSPYAGESEIELTLVASIVDRQYKNLLGLANLLCKHNKEAEDIAAEAVTRFVEGVRRGKFAVNEMGEKAIWRWLRTTMVHLYRDQTRSYAYRKVDVVGDEFPEGTENEADLCPEALIDMMRDIPRIRRALDKLKAPYREIIVMVLLEDISHAEYAEMLGISNGACRIFLYRAMDALACAYASEQ